MLPNVNNLATAIQRLNGGTQAAPWDFCIIVDSTGTYTVLYKENRKDASMEALGMLATKSGAEITKSGSRRGVIDTCVEDDEAAAIESGNDDKYAAVWAEAERLAAEQNAGQEDTRQKLTAQSEKTFYEGLDAAVKPFFDFPDAFSIEQAKKIVARGSNLDDTTKTHIIRYEVLQVKSGVDLAALTRIGRLVAHAQAGVEDLRNAANRMPEFAPEFDGIMFDGKKFKMLKPF